MRFSIILAASALAPLIAAHGAIPGEPKIVGLAPHDVAAMKSRNIRGGRAARAARSAHGSHFHGRQESSEGRCGKDFGCQVCAADECCSSGGWCGKGQDYCQAPDSLFDYGPAADANVLPSGGTTRNIARPKDGTVAYGGEGIYVCTKPGQIAITYDDGPYIYTDKLLDLFASYNMKATFFVTGINLYKGSIDSESTLWPGMIRRMVADGHQLASHTWSHQDLSVITKEQRYEQMVKLEMALSNIVGKFPTYMRPPFSSCSVASGCPQDMADLGYHISYFDLDTDDYNNITPEKAQIPKDNIKAALNSRNPATDEFLAIAHDIHYQTVYNMTVYMLDLMVQKGYKGVTMGDCLGDPEANWYRSPTGRVATSSVFTPPACASTRASTASGSRTSTAAVSTPTAVSTDASCGPASGFTCLGFAEGECCSQYNYCGNTEGHCGTGCQLGFGKCGLSSSSSVAQTSSRASSSASQSSTKLSSSSLVSSTKISSSFAVSSTRVSSSSVTSSSVRTSTSPSTSSRVSSSATRTSSNTSSSKASSSASSSKASSSASSSKVSSSASASSSPKASSTTLGTSTRASASSAASSTPSRITSPDATCGGTKGYTCLGFAEGECCSKNLWCGNTAAHCGTGCNPLFGKCTSSSASSSVQAASPSASKAASSSTVKVVSSTSTKIVSSSPGPVVASSSSTKVASSTPVIASSSTSKATSPSVAAPSSTTKPASTTPRASSTIATSTRASSSSASKPSGVVSPNGSCGSAKGYTCTGYYEGECCSQYGWCGSSTGHCGTKCQPLYGKCT